MLYQTTIRETAGCQMAWTGPTVDQARVAFSDELFKYGLRSARDEGCAAELVHEAFRILGEKIEAAADEKIEPAPIVYSSDPELLSLLKHFADGVLSNYRKRKKPSLGLDGLAVPSVDDVSLLDQLIADEQTKLILGCVDQLPPELRSVVRGVYYDGFSVAAFARALRLGDAGARKLLTRALNWLRVCLKNRGIVS